MRDERQTACHFLNVYRGNVSLLSHVGAPSVNLLLKMMDAYNMLYVQWILRELFINISTNCLVW